MILFAATNSIITLLDFDDTDEDFSYEKDLVPLSNNKHYYVSKKHCNYMARIFATKLCNRLAEDAVISKLRIYQDAQMALKWYYQYYTD